MIKDIPCTLSIVTKTSKKTGNDYRQIVLKVKGKDVEVGIVNIYTETALLRAGIDVRAE